MSRKKEAFINKSILKHGNKYDYSLVDYKSSILKVKILCPIHGVFEQTPGSHVRGQGCPLCANTKHSTKEIFIFKATIIHNNNYDYSLVNYTNNKTKVKIICPIHGIFEQRPDNHLNGSGCPKCANNILYTTDDFIKKSNIVHNFKYTYNKVEYKTAHTKVKIICPIHGEFVQKPSRHLCGDGCPKCSKKYMDTNYFKEISKVVHNNIYDYSLVDYKNRQTKVKILCHIHGIFEQNPGSHLNGSGCPKCKASKGELTIMNILNDNNISFITQKGFKGCIHKNPLKFDFYIPKLNTCIEFNGIQHYKPNIFFGGEEAFKYQLIRDEIKIKYCKQNNINLLIIKYNDNILNKLNIILYKFTYKKSPTDIYKEKAILKHNNKYDYSLVKYNKAKDKVIIICKIHGIFKQRADHHLNGCGCPKCNIIKRTKKLLSNTDDFIKKANKIHNNIYDYSKTNYKTAKDKVIIICKIHGEFNQTPNSHLNGNGCKKCGLINMAKQKRMSQTNFILKAKSIHGDKYDYTNTIYDLATNKTQIYCNIHKKYYTKSPNNHLSKKQGCPICNTSNGENEIIQILDANNIEYELQKTFSECKYIKLLRFDFYLPSFNMCIEFDGEQHYNENHYFNTKGNFKELQIRDNIKTNYCLNNNIILIRIKYNESVVDILKKNCIII